MRKGQNPAKFIGSVHQPQRITAAILNYIPFQSGYFSEMQNVLDVCLQNLSAHADLPFDLMVFDNGSCEEVTKYLLKQQKAGTIQYLILSDHNLGKGGAWNIMLTAAPGEIISYADNDVLFHPHWLSRSVQLLETYPNVGMVTARPFRTKPEFITKTIKWAKNTRGVKVETGKLLSWEVFREFNVSLGSTDEEIENAWETRWDVRLTYKNVKAYVGSSHWQFTAYKKVIQQFLPFDMDKPMGQVRQLDERMNAAGYLRLMVSDPLAMNMSNNVPTGMRGQAKPIRREPKGLKKRILEVGPVKKVLLGLYNRIFRWYYG